MGAERMSNILDLKYWRERWNLVHTDMPPHLKVPEVALEAGDGLVAALEARLEKMRGLLRLMDGKGERAYRLHAPEDGAVQQLCEAIGYGAVMDAAARLWYLKDPIGAFVVGPCASMLVDTMLDIDDVK